MKIVALKAALALNSILANITLAIAFSSTVISATAIGPKANFKTVASKTASSLVFDLKS